MDGVKLLANEFTCFQFPFPYFFGAIFLPFHPLVAFCYASLTTFAFRHIKFPLDGWLLSVLEMRY